MTTAKQQEALWMIPQDIYQVFKHMNTVIPKEIEYSSAASLGEGNG